MICQFIAAQAQVDIDKYGGRNPLADAAAEISITARPAAEDDELDDIRGEPTGWVTHEEGMRMARQAGGRRAPAATVDTLLVDSEGNVVAATLSGGEEALPEGAAEPQAGSFEALMQMFGAPPPPSG